jgi:tetratricopeptide (TPR) repeat protein
LTRALELDPQHADAMNYLGYLDADAGVNLDEARALIERAVELDPTNGAYIDSLGWVYYKLGQVDEAIEYLERAAQLLDTDPVIFDHLGDAYVKRHELEKARHNWQRALELDPSLTTVQEKLEQITPKDAVVATP